MELKQKAQLFRKRFHGRQDVYGKKVALKTITSADGKIPTIYAPQCGKFWDDVCYLKNRVPGKECGNCEHKQYIQVTDEIVMKHIKGEEEHIYYLIDPHDNTVYFAAVDFDCKPGKEDKGYTFEDVVAVAQHLKSWGIPYAIARSTTAGFHLYVFFKNAIEAKYPLALIHHVFEELGWSERHRNGIKPIPEIFPKQAQVPSDGLGNGIKPPMIEPQMSRGKNCWVNDDNAVIPVDEQWGFFTSIPYCEPELIIELCTTLELDPDIYRSGVGVYKNKGSKSSKSGEVTFESFSKRGLYIEKMLEGCAAMRGTRDRVLAGEVLGHDEGFALIHLAMNTEDGIEWCRTHMKGWFRDHRDDKQILHSIQKGYSPRTCANLQSLNLCKPGTKCFERKPPYDIVHGRIVPDKSIPENDWPAPSPIRYAYGAGDDFLNKLMSEVDILEKEEDKAVVEGKLKDIINRAKIFDKEQHKSLEKHIKEKKILKPKAVNSMFADMEIDKKKNNQEQMDGDDRVVQIGGKWISKGLDGHGYSEQRLSRGGRPFFEHITRTTLEIQYIKTLTDESQSKTFFGGKIICPDYNFETQFEVESDIFADARKFYTYLISRAHDRLDIASPVHLQLISQAAAKFAANSGKVKRFTSYTRIGWYNSIYVTPSVKVSVDGVFKNTDMSFENGVDASLLKHDFCILNDSEVESTTRIIFDNLLNAFPTGPVCGCLSHAALSIFSRILDYDTNPMAWLLGPSGIGKTELARTVGDFFGCFRPISWLGTVAYLTDTLFNLKDALIILDDYKSEIEHDMKNKANILIQQSFQNTIRGNLGRGNKNSRNEYFSRVSMLSTGEELPEGEASVLARLLYLPLDNWDTASTRENFLKVKKCSPKFSGVMPHFIHYVLTLDKNRLTIMRENDIEIFFTSMSQYQNARRVATTYGSTYFALKIWMQFFKKKLKLEDKATEKVEKEFFDYLLESANELLSLSEKELSIEFFKNALCEILSSGLVQVPKIDSFSDLNLGIESKIELPKIGYILNSEPDFLYLLPTIAISKISSQFRRSLPKATLRKQLIKAGIMIERQGVAKNTGHRTTTRFWKCSIQKIGFDIIPRETCV